MQTRFEGIKQLSTDEITRKRNDAATVLLRTFHNSLGMCTCVCRTSLQDAAVWLRDMNVRALLAMKEYVICHALLSNMRLQDMALILRVKCNSLYTWMNTERGMYQAVYNAAVTFIVQIIAGKINEVQRIDAMVHEL